MPCAGVDFELKLLIGFAKSHPDRIDLGLWNKWILASEKKQNRATERSRFLNRPASNATPIIRDRTLNRLRASQEKRKTPAHAKSDRPYLGSCSVPLSDF